MQKTLFEKQDIKASDACLTKMRECAMRFLTKLLYAARTDGQTFFEQSLLSVAGYTHGVRNVKKICTG